MRQTHANTEFQPENGENNVARLPFATREIVPENQRAAFDELVRARGSVPRTGPGSVLMHVPKVFLLEQELSHYLRDDASLPKKVQEWAMLVAARELDCQHIWNAHAASARKAGVPDSAVDALRNREELPPLAPDEAAVVHFGREYFRSHRVSQGTYQAALERFGRQGVVELGIVLGTYSLLALLINSFDTDLPDNRTELLLPV
jgi:4-carboxymuconolactone decarboxylase